MARTVGSLAALALGLAACTSTTAAEDAVPATRPPAVEAGTATSVTASGGGGDAATTRSPTTSAPTTTTAARSAAPRPAWLGTRVLPRRSDGFGQVLPTPPELVDRRLETPDHLPRPADERFRAAVGAVPDEVLARSTWSDACPVTRDELRYVTLPFHGFDGRLHTGELLVHVDVVPAIVDGFRVLFERRFPIEEMRVVRVDELDLPPTGDGNNTTAFVCRPARGTTSWSQHAYGRAVDVNPFHNPYVRDDLVLPELASAYVDRSSLRPGMLQPDDVAGFLGHGWGWGSRWRSLQDHMHLSASGT